MAKEHEASIYHQEGFITGLHSLAHPLLNIFLAHPGDELFLVPEKLPSCSPNKQFLNGYLSGLHIFIGRNALKLPPNIFLSDLLTKPAMTGYLKGLELDAPNFATARNTYPDSYHHVIWSNIAYALKRHLTMGGYTIGFMTRNIRDYNWYLNPDEVPKNESEYKSFMEFK